MPTESDRDLRWSTYMRKAQGGDASAYEELLKDLVSPLTTYFGRRGIDPHHAEDLAQETLLAVHRARHTYLPERPFSPWLFAIARNKLFDFMRERSGARTATVFEEDVDFETLPAATPIGSFSLLKSAVATLSSKQREVLGLLRLKGLSIRAVAEQLGITESDVKVTAHRAHRALEEKLGT